MGERFLVVISALEGRGFPKRSRHKLIAEARFDGELLATDPVDHVDCPDFTQELAWELDKKALQQHRLQRTSVKIQCFALDTNSGLKEPIGYVILDVRSAVQGKQTAKWYPLLHCKYGKSKPEIRLTLYLDEDKSPQKDGTVKVTQERDKKAGSAIPTNVNVKGLVPVLNEEEGFYQLGPAHTCCDHFVLSVTIAYANNLPQLVPSSTPLPATSGGFFFYYSLLGNDVTNETFSNLLNPAFPAERASVRVRSSVDALRMFFGHQPGLQIHLCCGDQSLGSCEVPLKTLLKKDSTEIYMKPVSVEGDFQLVPPNKVKQQIPALPTSLSPVVGVSVVLRKEDMGAVTPVKDHANNAALPLSATSSPVHKSSPSQHSPPQRDRPSNGDRGGKEKEQQQTKLKHGDGGDGGKGEDYSDSFEEDTHNSASLGEQVKKMAGQRQETNPGHAGPSQPPQAGGAVDSLSTSEVHHAIPPQAHHFTFALDLRSIRDHVSPNTVSVFLRYTYPFFGSAAPILTHPPVEIRKGSEVLLPQSFCAFDFACTMQQLQDTFRRIPLTVEVWHRDRQLSTDVLLGTARLPLSSIITVEKMRTMGANNVTGWRQEFADRVPVTAMEGQVQQCADISVVMTLEDWGPIAPTIINGDSSSLPQAVQVPPANTQRGNSYPQQELPASPRQTSEYQAALELEIWKETQQQTFEKELKQKESQYMRALAEEWKKRDKEREVLMQKKLTEYTQWETQLKKTLADLEKRDKQLSANEREVSRLRSELQREHDRKLQEMKEASRRMKDDCDHQIDLERMKVKELEEIISRYKAELQEADRKHKALEKEFSTFKEQLNSKPEVRLQSEINLLTLEKVELERKLEAANQSKMHYKQQWGRALKEVARMKQREQEAAKASLRQQQQELEHMRLRYLAAEEKDVAKSDNQQLEEIKNELNKLKQMEADKMKQSTDSNFTDSGRKPLNTDMDSSIDEHISRLVEERDTLLRTGVYTTQDKIIIELDRQIREAIAQRNR